MWQSAYSRSVPVEAASSSDRFAAIAAPELVGLPSDQLIDAMLDRLVTTLEVDTAVVLALEPARTHLVAMASRGLEEEVLQGVRVPVGAGFAGTIALHREPMVLSDVRPGTVFNPLLLHHGVQSMAGVPMLASGELIGVLHVGTLTQRQFLADDIDVLRVAAERLATSILADRVVSDRAAARILQRSLLPSALPTIEGIRLATRFIPASNEGLGGDWYDAFRLPAGGLGVVMGDVTGSGLAAAVVMGRLRSALRAYAIESAGPGEALDRLNRKFLHFEPDQMATVLYMIVSADRDSITIASSGHPPPIVAERDHEPVFAECDPNPPIGVSLRRPHPERTVQLPVDTVVAAYTDGLFERRHQPFDGQLEKLRSSVSADDPETVCSSVMMSMIGTHRVEDDTALIVLRRTQ